MFKNYLITAWRNIIKNGIFSAINIFGLSVGLMSCLLIMLFVRAESGYDKWLTDYERVARIHTAFTMPNQPPFLTVRSAGRMMEAIRDYAQNEVETGVRLIQWNLTVRKGEDAFDEAMTMADGSFFDVFDLPFAHGDKETSYSQPLNLVVTEELALKYFGRTNVIGETLTVCCVGPEPAEVAITGVLKDLPDETHLNINMLFYLQPALFQPGNGVLDTWTSVNVYTYFKLNQGIELAQFQERMEYWLNNESPLIEMSKQFLGDKADGKQVTDFVSLNAMKLGDLHLHAKKDAGNMGDLTPMGDAEMIQTFTVVAMLVLIIACINFMNLSTAKASKRAKEVAMRKVLGASRGQVAIQFLSEAITLVFIALLFAVAAAELVLPFYNEVIGKDLQLQLFDDPSLLLLLIMIATVVGIGAGIYPAMYLSRFLPGHILKASKSSESGSTAKMRSALVIFQFAASIILVVATIVVYAQTIYSTSADVGFKSDNKLVLNIRSTGDNLQSLKQELLNLPEVKSVTFSSEAPTQDNENNNQFTLLETDESGNKVEPVFFNYHNMDYGFFEAYQVAPLAGRLFSEDYGTDQMTPLAEDSTEIGQASVVLNETAIKKLGFTEPKNAIGKTLALGRHHLTIIGVIPDIHFRSIKFGIRASAYMLNPSRFRVANIEFTSNNLANLMSSIEQVWKQNVPLQPISLQFLSEMMAAQYQDERTTAQLFLSFSLLAILVACLGLYGLSAFTVERRTKEIGIRKVMGANVRDIVRLLMWQFSKPVMLANILAWPIAIYAMASWLEAFPYRIDSWWFIPICLGVGQLSLIIAWVTVGGNAARVARKNPVHSLRYE
ncbi:FtsX-like permease family protein [Thalassotalea sp. M1531]|uniref:FtsX-like permease family protein n=1 Tax=Thalassotalea algicola TaxID=2716224 RepID=A0A7Y0Q678_9GAMM|nr:ABC transporter permease [Thalassotalea algicola]NMP31098.1 FtsX-like permease family protein [Thalassotalea algicola]